MPAQRPQATADSVSRNALALLATIAVGVVLYLLADILTPLALAIFLALMIDGLARMLQTRLRTPARAAMPLAVTLSVVIFGVAAVFVADNASVFAGKLVEYGPRLNGLIQRIASLFGVEAPPSVADLMSRLNPSSYLGQVAQGLQGFVSTAAFVLVYLGFILASRRGWERKAVSLFSNRERRHEVLEAFLRIRNGVEQYLWVQTVTGLMIAGVSWIAMVAVGLDNALFWAILIFLASYIPVIGGIVGVAAPPVFALIQFETLWQAIVLVAVLQSIGLFVGNVVQPRMQGRSLNMDPIVLLLALAFWSVIWGLPGAFLSTPLTTVMMVVLAQFEGTRWIAVLLSADGDPGQARRREAAARSKPARGRPSAKS